MDDDSKVSEGHPGTAPEPGEPPRREPFFNLPGVVTAMAGLCIAIHLLRTLVLTPDADLGLIVATAFIPLRYRGEVPLDLYAFTSPVTYSLLHGGWLHLVVNLVWLAAFGSPLARRLGTARFLIFWGVTAVAAAALHGVIHANDAAPLVGASGAIAGMMGASARFLFRTDRQTGAFSGAVVPVGAVLRSRTSVVFLLVWAIVNVASGVAGVMPGVDGQIAWEAHVGGFLAGFFGIGLFGRGERASPVD